LFEYLESSVYSGVTTGREGEADRPGWHHSGATT